MNSPVEMSRLRRFLSLPHTLCLFAAMIFLVAACACVAQGTGQAALSLSAPTDAETSPTIQHAAIVPPLPAASETAPGQAALIYYKETLPLRATPPRPAVKHAPFPPDITRGDSSMMEVSLTFDGGSGRSGETAEILDALKERSIRTTFFLTGQFIRENPEAVRRMIADGHEVGNHTLTHPHLTTYARNYSHTTIEGVGPAALARELEGAEELFREVTGRDMAPLWRAPYGEVNGEMRRWALEAGYVHIGWTSDYVNRESLDTLDWVYDRSSRFYRSPEEIKDRIMGFGKDRGGIGGGIILMHLNTRRTSDRAALMVGDMLDALTGRGYRFVKVSTLIKSNQLLKEARSKRNEQVASAGPAGAGVAHR